MSLHETAVGLGRVALEPGRDYNVVVVSFDPAGTPKTAALTKNKYKGDFGSKPGFDAGWHLNRRSAGISKLAASVGFDYRWDDHTKQFIHAGGIMSFGYPGTLMRGD
jgi:protein SCO1/2